jgi:hypothetical protein
VTRGRRGPRPVAATCAWVRVPLLALLVPLLPLLAVPRGAILAQGQCNERGDGNCTVGGNATFAAFVTVTAAVRLSSPATSVSLTSPTGSEYDAGFGPSTGPVLTMKANTAWTVTIRSTQATWTASPAPARANKPLADLLWSTSATGPFTAMSTNGVSIATGVTGTPGTAIPLHFRVLYAWSLDTPGTYSLPLQLTVTAP